MKMPTSKSLALFAALCLVVSPVLVSAQEWSAPQKEVWKSVEAYWALDDANDTAAFLEYFHADYSGWSVEEPLPGDKAAAKKFISHNHKTGKTLLTHIQTVAIKIHGDIAIVHYYWSRISQKKSNDKEATRSGRWTDVLKKQGDKWLLIADHGGALPNKGD
jgi:ketosteroid isomerase-like protein